MRKELTLEQFSSQNVTIYFTPHGLSCCVANVHKGVYQCHKNNVTKAIFFHSESVDGGAEDEETQGA